MNTHWINTQSDTEAVSHSNGFWSALKQDLNAGEFWADRIKQYRNEPKKRLRTAINNLPLPAAFREAAVATRTIVRSKRKSKENYNEELALLYWLGALESFMLPFAHRLKEPGYNVMEAIPGGLFRSLPINYQQLGYDELQLLNKTDKKWLVESWGEPASHTTLNKIYWELWDKYENKLIQRRQEEREKSKQELWKLLSSSSAKSSFNK